MREMSDAERREFLLQGTRTAKLAIVRADGRPHVTPVWFVLDSDDIVLTTGATSIKGKSLLRDARVSLCVGDQTPPYSYVMIEGIAAISSDLDEMLTWTTRIGGRYMGLHQADAYGRRNAVAGELLVRITPTHIIARWGIAD